MSEPTIDEMLEFMNHMSFLRGNNAEIANAIRAILEQHKRMQESPLGQDWLHAGIRAFVERVEKRIVDAPDDFAWLQAVKDELAAMEAEVKEWSSGSALNAKK